jgi:hypothetical protein
VRFLREQKWFCIVIDDMNEKPPEGRLFYLKPGFPLSRE